MKDPLRYLKIVLLCIIGFSHVCRSQNTDLTAADIVEIADKKMRGNSSHGEYSMTIVRPSWTRTVTMKSWSKGYDYSLIYITSPAKEKGQVFLKRKNEMWNWIPTIERLVKIPPSMMMQSWMGSDFTNDDLLKESSLIKDYRHEFVGSEKVAGYDCYRIDMYPLEEAAIVWGKLTMWISKDGFHRLKTEYYDEDLYLINVEILSDIRLMDDREIPTHMEMTPVGKPGNKTVIVFKNIRFEVPIKESFFSQQNMKRLR